MIDLNIFDYFFAKLFLILRQIWNFRTFFFVWRITLNIGHRNFRSTSIVIIILFSFFLIFLTFLRTFLAYITFSFFRNLTRFFNFLRIFWNFVLFCVFVYNSWFRFILLFDHTSSLPVWFSAENFRFIIIISFFIFCKIRAWRVTWIRRASFANFRSILSTYFRISIRLYNLAFVNTFFLFLFFIKTLLRNWHFIICFSQNYWSLLNLFVFFNILWKWYIIEFPQSI